MTSTTRCYFTDSPHTDEKGTRFDGHAKVLQDGEKMHVSLMAHDSATAPVRVVDSEGRPAGRRSGYAFDSSLTQDAKASRQRLHDAYEARLCNAWRREDFQVGDHVQMLNKPHVVTGYNEDGNIVLHDVAHFDGDTLKQHAYDSHNEYLTNAWRRDAVSSYGPWKEGSECTLNGAPGHIKNGECIPDDSSEEHSSDARDVAYKQSVQQLTDAWKR